MIPKATTPALSELAISLGDMTLEPESEDLEQDLDEDPFADLDPERHAILIQWLKEADAEREAKSRSRRLRQLAVPVVRRRTRPRDFGDQRGVSPPLAVRLPRWLDEQLRRRFSDLAVTPSEGIRQILEEWMVPQLFPALEYRGAGFPRLAAIRQGPTVVEWLITTPERPLSPEVMAQVQDYVELFRARIELELRRA